MGTTFEVCGSSRRAVRWTLGGGLAVAVGVGGCAVSAEQSAGDAREPTAKTTQAMNVLSCQGTYSHGGNLWSQDFTANWTCPCDPEQRPALPHVTSTGLGWCFFQRWTNQPNPNADPSQPQQCGFTMSVHNDEGFADGQCEISVEETPIGHTATFTNDLVGDQASAWFATNGAAIFPTAGEAVVTSTANWNAVNIFVPTTPGASCMVSATVQTSSNIDANAVLLSVNREPSQQVLGHVNVGPLPNFTVESFSFTAEDNEELFFAGFWGEPQAPWMRITNLTVTCQPQLSVFDVYQPDVTQDTFVGVSGQGFVDGPVRLWYSGVPGLGDSDGWQYGAVLQASRNVLVGWDESTLVVGPWNGCPERNPPGMVQIMAIDSVGNESPAQSIPACRICGGC
jgi:hypothetical protein